MICGHLFDVSFSTIDTTVYCLSAAESPQDKPFLFPRIKLYVKEKLNFPKYKMEKLSQFLIVFLSKF